MEPKNSRSDDTDSPMMESRLVAPLGTADLDPKWLGRIAKKPWEYRVTAGIPHLNTPKPLRVCIDVLRDQTEPPYIIVVDTGSSASVRAELESFRDEDVEIHYLAGHAYRHPSEPITTALDLIQARCQTTYLYQTHADCFLRRREFLEELCAQVDENTPAIGYRMSPRDWATADWEWMIGHTASLFHHPTLQSKGITWSFYRMNSQFGVDYRDLGGWPDTETGFNLLLREAGITPKFIGDDRNFERQTDENIDHVRNYTGSSLYSWGYHQECSAWMIEAIADAQGRLRRCDGNNSRNL